MTNHIFSRAFSCRKCLFSSSCSLVSCAVSSCAYDFNPTKYNRGNIHDSPRRPPVGEIDSRVAHKPSHLELPSTPD
ncbi:hypothetical protein T05_12034 [Trichinella murrelli]|uniref:Uncharacterized protein n=1 Tax=Trichinella murrelli TaxID=144512 RepID=A0A0V0T6G5_9BILA|nr:hypothetical protein T05_12034 [Trichinella murrelli]